MLAAATNIQLQLSLLLLLLLHLLLLLILHLLVEQNLRYLVGGEGRLGLAASPCLRCVVVACG